LAALSIVTMPRSELFKNDLLNDEKILWIGQPETSVMLTRDDFLPILFGSVFLIMGVIYEMSVFNDGELFPFLFGLLFVIVGAYLLFGRFIQKKYLKKRTYYAVTHQRVLILTNFMSKGLQSKYIHKISDINKTVSNSGIGTIQFDNYPCTHYNGENIDYKRSFIGFGFDPIPTFYDIKGVDNIYHLINDLRKNDENSNHASST
jgi:hypothetical protein